MDERLEICEGTCVHWHKVMRVREALRGGRADNMADRFKASAGKKRTAIIQALSLEEELCICDICAIVGCSKTIACHHLCLLKKMGLAKTRQVGRIVYYALDDDIRGFAR